MRGERIIGEPGNAGNCYHVMSRAIEGRFIFDDVGKERFRVLLERHAEMAGIEVFTWCCMGNHFHLLVEVPNAEITRAALDDEEILRRVGLVCSAERLKGVREQWLLLKEQSEKGAVGFRDKLLARMFDLSVFMKELKQAYSQWHNKRVKRKGPLWQDRFKSVLLENDEKVLLTMAAYIDLNPVRAGLVRDPKDYRWSGYGEAVVGKAKRRAGLRRVVGKVEGSEGNQWRGVQAQYRRYLYGEGEEYSVEGREAAAAALVGNSGSARQGGKRRRGMKASAVARVETQRGQLGLASLLRVRVRYFTQSVAFGSREFVEDVFARNREKMRVKRAQGARVPKDEILCKEAWCGLLDLRSEVEERRG